MSHKKRNKSIGGKDGVVFDRPVPKFLQPYIQPPSEQQVDIEAKWESQVADEVNVHEEIANLRKQGFQVQTESSSYRKATTISPYVDEEQSDSGKRVEKEGPPSNSVISDERKPTPTRGQTIASIGIKKRHTNARKTQKSHKKLSLHRGQTKTMDRQLLSFQEQDE